MEKNLAHGKRQTQFSIVMKRLLKNKVAMGGLAVITIMILVSVLAPFITKYSPTEMDYANILSTPSKEHWFGCDALGRDIFSRVLHGGRYSLALGFAGTLFGSFIGTVFGLVAGYAGGRTDMLLMRFMDIISAIPGMLLAIIISTALGSGFFNTVLALSVGGIPATIRQVRALCLKEREMEYIEASKSVNCSEIKIMFKHMLPNIISPMIVGMTMGIGVTIMSAAGLSFIGLGIQPPTPEWGAMLSDGRANVLIYPHLMLFPGIAITILVLSVNLFGDGLRDALDPKLKD